MFSNDYVRTAFKALQDSTIADIECWDASSCQSVVPWQETLLGLEGMIARVSQETELHRRQVLVIKSEMQAFERSARATSILDIGAGRAVELQADLIRSDLNQAEAALKEFEDNERRLRLAADLASEKIRLASININEAQGLAVDLPEGPATQDIDQRS